MSSALLDSAPPRDPAAVAPLVKAATRLHRVVFYCALGLAAVLAAVIVAGAARDELPMVLPSALVPAVLIGLPFLYFWRRGRRRLIALAVAGQRLTARVTDSEVVHVGYGTTVNRIVAEFVADGVERRTSLAVGGNQRRHAPGDELSVLFSPATPRVVIACSEQVGVVLGQTMTVAEASVPRRAGRIIIGVVIGSLLFFGLLALLVLSQSR